MRQSHDSFHDTLDVNHSHDMHFITYKAIRKQCKNYDPFIFWGSFIILRYVKMNIVKTQNEYLLIFNKYKFAFLNQIPNWPIFMYRYFLYFMYYYC